MLEGYLEQFGRLWIYAGYCIDNSAQPPICQEFWSWTVYLGLLTACVAGRKIVSEQLE